MLRLAPTGRMVAFFLRTREWRHMSNGESLPEKKTFVHEARGFSTQAREPLQYEVMVRSTYRLVLALPVVLFSFVAYAQQSAAPQSDNASQSEQQQTPPAASVPIQSSPGDALPDDPGTTAHIQPPIEPQGPTAVFDTSMGRMTCGLYSKEAPRMVANFVGLATGSKEYTDPVSHKKVQRKPYYDGTTFHRVIPGFMIQGGDPSGTGTGDPGYFVNDEITPDLNFDGAGRLAMANAGPNTNGSQFFITVAPQPSLDQNYTIFGQCDPASILVAASITQVPRNPQDKPLDPVYLNKVTIVQPGQPMPPVPPPAKPQAEPGTTQPPPEQP